MAELTRHAPARTLHGIETTANVARPEGGLPASRAEDPRHQLVYLDSASSSQRPKSVLDAMDHYYENSHANVHRGVYAIAEEADALLRVGTDEGRAGSSGHPIPRPRCSSPRTRPRVSTWSRTSWAATNLEPGDAVLLTEMEHHANLVPWLMLAEQKGIELRWLDVDDSYRLDLSNWTGSLDGVKLVACTVMSNVLGTIPPFATDRGGGARSRRCGRGGRRAGSATPASRRDCARLRLLGIQRSQDARPHRDRRPLGTPGAARGDAPVPGRRRDDPRRPQGRIRTEHAALEVRGRYAADRRSGRARGRRRLPVGDRDAARHRPRQEPDGICAERCSAIDSATT